MIYRKSLSSQLIVERMPDGSTAILDERSKSVHSLNASAAAIWDACAGGATISQIEKAMGAPGVPEAIEQLASAGLVESEAGPVPPEAVNWDRRALLRGAGVALPVILTLTAAQQKAYAQGSGTPRPTTTPRIDV